MNAYSLAGMLSDNGIKEYFKKGIDIYTDEKDGFSFDLDKQLHVGSIDLHFRHLYRRINLANDEVLSYKRIQDHDYTQPFELRKDEKLIIEPGEIILTTTSEIVNLTEDFAAIITGRSSIARLGIMVHCCQEFIHPGHGQSIPLQIVNLSKHKVELEQSIPICQIVFFKLATPASKKYIDRFDAKYSKEKDPESSKIFQDMPKEEQNEGIENKSSFKSRISQIRGFVNKYISPFIPSIITLLVITPFLKEYVMGKTGWDVLQAIQRLPLPVLLSVILLAVFIFSKKGEGK